MSSINRLAFAFSGLFTLMGIWLYMLLEIINRILPKLGLAAFQVARNGSYSPEEYLVDFSSVAWIPPAMIISGLILSVIFYLLGRRE